MHIPDGVLDPGTLVVASAASAGALVWSAHELRHGHPRWGLALGGAAAVLVFHLADVPLYGAYTAHVIGGTLLAIGLGPWLAILTMSAVLALEALAWGDGGVAALGVNILVMAVVGVLAGWLVYKATPGPRVIAAAAAAWVSVMASGLTLAAVSAVGGDTTVVLTHVLPHHAAWGLLEGLVTATVVAAAIGWRHVRARRQTIAASAPAQASAEI